MPALETEALSKAYGRMPAVEDLNLTVEQGEIFGFLGANGAGKTTTVKMLLGLARPTGGQARVLGRRPGDPAAMARIGFLPEHFRFHPWLRAGDFLDFHGRLYGMSPHERRKRIPELLRKVGLERWADARLSHFSKGMLQRIGLAQALLNNPSLLFLDEPTSGLDPLGRREMRDIVKELRDAGVTVFLNSHMLSEVEAVCTRVGIVRQGKLAYLGALGEMGGRAVILDIRAEGMTEEILAGLRRWGTLHTSDDGRGISLEVAGEDMLPDIAAWLTHNGVRLYSFAPHKIPLEELFVHVMEGQA